MSKDEHNQDPISAILRAERASRAEVVDTPVEAASEETFDVVDGFDSIPDEGGEVEAPLSTTAQVQEDILV